MNKDVVKKIAELARLDLGDEEITRYSEQMDDIIRMFDKISAVDTAETAPLIHVHDKTMTLVEDEILPSVSREQLLANAPDTEYPYIKVPLVIDKAEK